MLSPRTIHGLSSVTAHPGRQVMVVPGIETADAAAILLADVPLAIVTWPNGGPDTCDWQPLAGRRVILWPEGTAVGGVSLDALAAILVGIGCAVRVVEGGEGLASGIQAGWTAPAVIDYAKARARDWTGPIEEEVRLPEQDEPRPGVHSTRHETRPHPSAPRGAGGAALALGIGTGGPHPNKLAQHTVGNVTAIRGATIPLPDDLDDYRANFVTDEHGKIAPRIDKNYFWMLRGHPAMRGIFAFNVMENRPFLMARPPWDRTDGKWASRPLSEGDVGETLMWLQTEGMRPKKQETRDAIKLAAGYTKYNPVVDYLRGLRWDGCPRLQGGAWESDTVPPLSTEYLGAPPDDIFATFVTKWHVAAVARAFRPGIKVDTMMILESAQGKFKSTYLRSMATIHGHEYFASDVGDIGNAGSVMLLQGCWIVEIAELAGVKRQEIEIVKSWLSRTTDRYVPKYEGEPRDVPRNYIVAGTHNPSGHGYLKDPTGARRFWPVPITEVDLDRVERDRDQIWAEAVMLFHAGVRWWLTPDEERAADELTGERRVEHPWESKIDDAAKGMPSITLPAIIAALQIPIGQQTELTSKIVSERLRGTGYIQGRDKTWRRGGEAVQGEML